MISPYYSFSRPSFPNITFLLVCLTFALESVGDKDIVHVVGGEEEESVTARRSLLIT